MAWRERSDGRRAADPGAGGRRGAANHTPRLEHVAAKPQLAVPAPLSNAQPAQCLAAQPLPSDIRDLCSMPLSPTSIHLGPLPIHPLRPSGVTFSIGDQTVGLSRQLHHRPTSSGSNGRWASSHVPGTCLLTCGGRLIKLSMAPVHWLLLYISAQSCKNKISAFAITYTHGANSTLTRAIHPTNHFMAVVALLAVVPGSRHIL